MTSSIYLCWQVGVFRFEAVGQQKNATFWNTFRTWPPLLYCYPWPCLKTGTWGGGKTPADGSGEIPQASGLGWWRRCGKLVREDGQTWTCYYTHTCQLRFEFRLMKFVWKPCMSIHSPRTSRTLHGICNSHCRIFRTLEPTTLSFLFEHGWSIVG